MSLILDGVDYGTIFGASGVQGMFGEGYWFHPLLEPFGLDFDDMGFVAKTMTAEPTQGNMRYDFKTMRPVEFFPACIVMNRKHEVMLNAIGLSNPGCVNLLEREIWQKRTKPFMLSFMANSKESAIERLRQTTYFAEALRKHLKNFRAPVALQVNSSCPNVGINPSNVVHEMDASLDVFGSLGIPLIPKFNVLVPPDVVKKIAKHPKCSAICMSNTLPWADVPPNWRTEFFGSQTSPLDAFGGGGLSGRPLLPMLLAWLLRARNVNIGKQLLVGGGILSKNDLGIVRDLRIADAFFIGSVASLHPLRVKGIIKQANTYK